MKEEIYLKVKNSYENALKDTVNYIDGLENKLLNEFDDRKKTVYKHALIRKANYLKDIKNILNNIREPYEEDIEYRKNIMNNYAKEIEKNIPGDLNLCFHGCPIYTAKEIIKDKKISSSADRIGVETSYDTNDQVSVTTKDTIITTLDGYTDIHALNYCLPCGVIFVINPKDEMEIESSKSMLITTVDFNDENRLKAIISSPENIDKLKEWCNNSNIDSNMVHTFEEFINLYQNKNVR